MKGRSSKILIAVALATVGAQAVSAAERSNLERVIVCADESDDTRRLACYDREIARVKPQAQKAETAAQPAPAPPTSVAATAAQPAPAAAAAAVAAPKQEETFGLPGSEVARQRHTEEREAKTEVRSISAKVTGISSRPRGELVFTLDNGQVWAQKKPEPYFPVKIGDAVTINAGMLGSFRLLNGNRSTQVTRVK